jgi:hypothetical protein
MQCHFIENLLPKTLQDVTERPETDHELVLLTFADLQPASWRVYHIAGISPVTKVMTVWCTPSAEPTWRKVPLPLLHHPYSPPLLCFSQIVPNVSIGHIEVTDI